MTLKYEFKLSRIATLRITRDQNVELVQEEHHRKAGSKPFYCNINRWSSNHLNV